MTREPVSRRGLPNHLLGGLVMMLLLLPAGATRADPERLVLEGVPRIGYDVHLCPFPGSLYSVLQYLGDPCDYDYLMGVTGAAFRRFWSRDDGGNVDLMYLAPEPYERAAKALGYELRLVGSQDKQQMIQALRESLARGRPALAFGVIGPPECGIVTGYDRDGEVLHGWSYFQDQSVTGCYQQEDWFGNTKELLIVGGKREGPRPSERETLLSSLEWAVDLARTARRPNRPDHVSGLAAYEAWAKGLETDADYPLDNLEVLKTRSMVQGDQCVMLAERQSAANYLRSMVDVAPEAAGELEAAAALYEQVAGQVGAAWHWGGNTMDPEVARALAEPKTRREIARHVRLARDSEAKAVEHVEAALKLLKAKPG